MMIHARWDNASLAVPGRRFLNVDGPEGLQPSGIDPLRQIVSLLIVQ